MKYNPNYVVKILKIFWGNFFPTKDSEIKLNQANEAKEIIETSE